MSKFRSPRKLGRRDANEREIIDALESCACDVVQLNWPGDLLVGRGGRNYILEVKDGDKVPSAQKLTELEEVFHRNWRGQGAIVRTADEALEAVGLIKRG